MRLSRFLLRYRITPHSATCSSPAELMMGRKLQTQLDLMLPDVGSKVQDCRQDCHKYYGNRSKERQFDVSSSVYARNYSQGPLWLTGMVLNLEGSVMYQIRLNNNQVILRHIDQMRPRVSGSQTTVPGTDNTLQVRPVTLGRNRLNKRQLLVINVFQKHHMMTRMDW